MYSFIVHGRGTTFQDKKKRVGSRKFNKRRLVTCNTLGKEHFDVWRNQKSGGGNSPRNENSERCEKLAKDIYKGMFLRFRLTVFMIN